MTNDAYQPTRREILTGGLALAGLSVVSPLQVLAQQTKRRYDVKFEFRDENYRRYSSIVNPRFDEGIKDKPRTDELRQRSAQEIREVYERLVQSNIAPDTSLAERFLDELVAKMIGNPHFLADKDPIVLPSETGGLVRVLSNYPNAQDNYNFDLGFTGTVTNGKIKAVVIGKYLIQLPEPGHKVEEGIPYEISGNVDNDSWYRIAPDKSERALSLKPLDDKDKLTIGQLDLFGRRAKLMRGLANQDLDVKLIRSDR